MVTELSLFSGGEYELFILMHMPTADESGRHHGETLEDVKLRLVPEELCNMTHLWSYDDRRAAYPRVGEYE